MSSLHETFVLENGVAIPKIGLGTWQVPNGETTYHAVSFALKNGYRHIDTAYAYHNEESVGKAVRDSGIDRTKENIEVWKAMEEIYESGRCRAIGVSNFSVSDLKAVMENAKIKPMVNQIRYFIGHTQEDVTAFCQDNGILVEAYSPLATGKILENTEIQKIADKYGKTLPQVCIRYCLQKGVLPLPKSTHEAFILQNADVDFEISSEDMQYLDQLKETEK